MENVGGAGGGSGVGGSRYRQRPLAENRGAVHQHWRRQPQGGASGGVGGYLDHDQYPYECGCGCLHVSGGSVDGAAAARKFSAVRHDSDGGSLVRLHQSCGIPNKPDGTEARRVYFRRLRESRTAAYAGRRNCGDHRGADGLWVLKWRVLKWQRYLADDTWMI